MHQQSNIPEYNTFLRSDGTADISNDSPTADGWTTPRVVTPSAANSTCQKRQVFHNGQQIPTKDIQSESRQLPVAQVMPNVPSTPLTHQKVPASPKHHIRKEARSRNLFDPSDRQYTLGRNSDSHVIGMLTRPPAEGTTGDSWDVVQDGYLDKYHRDSILPNFGVPNMEETLSQSVMLPDMTLVPSGKGYVSPQRRRSSSVPPKGRQSLPEKTEAVPSKSLYSSTGGIHLPMDIHLPGNIPQHHYPLPTFEHENPRKIQDLTSWQRTLHTKSEDAVIDHLKSLEVGSSHLHPSSNHPYSYGVNTDPQTTATVGKYPDPLLLTGGFGGAVSSYGMDLRSLEGLIQAKERILQDKNLIIERQKMELNQLQEKAREREAEERHKLYTSSGETRLDLLLLKLQEKDYEIYSLRDQLTQMYTTKSTEIDQVTRKLSQSEYEMKKLEEREKEQQSILKKEIEKLTAQVKQKETGLEDTKDKYKKAKDKYEKLKVKVQSLEHYLKDLPTADDYAKSTEYISSMKQSEALLKQRITDLETDLTEARKVRQQAEFSVSTLEEKITDMEFENQRLKTELGKMQQAMGAADSADPTSLKLYSRVEFEIAMKEKDRLSQEVQQLQKVADSKHKQIRKLQLQHKDQIHEMERRLMQEEDGSVALKEEIKNREMDIEKLRRTVKNLAAENQEILAAKLKLQDENKELQNVVSSEKFKDRQEITKDLSDCIKEVQNLVGVCCQSAEGAEPNVSMLLGIRSSSSMSCDAGYHGDTEEDSLKRQVEQLQQIRQDIELLRGYLSDKYAEAVGENCVTQ